MHKYKRSAKTAIAAAVLRGIIMPASAGDYVSGFAAYIAGDHQTALTIWEPLALQGDGQAQYGLGTLYERGYGVIQDYVKAHMWWTLAAAQGHNEAFQDANTLKRKMTSSQLRRAKDLAERCASSKFQDC